MSVQDLDLFGPNVSLYFPQSNRINLNILCLKFRILSIELKIPLIALRFLNV